ncbi:MAG: ATP-binding protein [Terriglobia bacterium]|jgi:signal transduction histidine kinase
MTQSRFNLQTKIIIIFAIAVVSVVGVSTYIAMLLTRLLVEEEIYGKACTLARSAAHQLVNEDALQDTAKLQRVLKQIQHDMPGVRQADVYLHESPHQLEATTAPQAKHLELDNIPGIERYDEFDRPDDETLTIETDQGRYWIIGVTIRSQGQPVGCLNLKVSKSQTSIVTRQLVMRNLLLMLASLVVVILAVHIFFLRAVRSPVKDMIRVMEGAEKGQLHVRASLRSTDEIGMLAAHLNRMLRRIENFNTELERKVLESTAGLAEANEELRRINEELFETQKNLARSERLAIAGQLAASLAHEIGTPLNSISGHVQLLARRKDADESTRRRLQIIERQIDNIVRTVNQLLSWSRKFELKVEMVDLRRLIEEAVLLSSPVLQLRKIRVKLDLAKDCPKIYGDGGYLQQVLLNLINNSMDAMPRGGDLRIETRQVEGAAPQVAIRVTDNGSGMSPETVAHAFDPMFTTKRLGTGTGLGLAICDQIVRQHGGTIGVESTPGKGTTFTLVLPVDEREKTDTVEVATGAEGGNG